MYCTVIGTGVISALNFGSITATVISLLAVMLLSIYLLWAMKMYGTDICDSTKSMFQSVFKHRPTEDSSDADISMKSYIDAADEAYSHYIRCDTLDIIRNNAKVVITKDDWLAMMCFSKGKYRLDALAWWDDGFLKAFIMGFNATRNPMQSMFIASMFNEYRTGYQTLVMMIPRTVSERLFPDTTKIVDMFQAYIDSGHDIHDMLPLPEVMADEARYSARKPVSNEMNVENGFLARAADGTPYRSIYLDLIKEHGENALLQDTSIIQQAFKKHE
jgi:hypothetical protein